MLSFQNALLKRRLPGIEQGWNKDGNSCEVAKAGNHIPRAIHRQPFREATMTQDYHADRAPF
jgi:hypothetical protein